MLPGTAATTDPALVPTALARALGLSLANIGDTLQSVVTRVGDRSMLIVLDNCERLLDGVAALVETMFQRRRACASSSPARRF